MKRKRLFLTGVGDIIIEMNKNSDGVPKCNSGHTREFYENLGLSEDKIPQEIKDKEKEGENIKIKTEEVFSDIIIYEDDIKLIVEEDDGYTTIFLKGGMLVTVVESAFDIDNYIEMLTMGWFETEWMLLKEKFRRIKNRIMGKKEVDLQEIMSRPENNPNNYTETIIN
jgi:hypothetical protein